MDDERKGDIRCSVLGHAWDQIPNTRAPEFGVLLSFRCIRNGCDRGREDIVNRFNGELLSRRYLGIAPSKLLMQDARMELINADLIQARATRRKRKGA